MEDLYTFFKSLNPGDVITSVGCTKKKSDETVLTMNGSHHKGWNKYARISRIASSGDLKKSDTKPVIGVIWEGIDPSLSDCFIHAACAENSVKANLRITNKTEHKAFIEEYIKNRMQLAEHDIKESQDIIKRCRAKTKELKKIAATEKIDADKLVKEE